MSTIDESLFGKIRRELLYLFFLNPQKSFFLLEIVDLLQTGRGGVQRELANLLASSIISKERSGTKVLFSLSENFDVLDEISRLLHKLANHQDLLNQVIDEFKDSIQTAVISTSGTGESSASFKMLVSYSGDGDLFREAIERIELLRGVQIELLIVPPSELSDCIRERTAAQWIQKGDWTLLAGKVDDIEPGEIADDEEVREPDLFTGTDFNW